MPYAKDTRKDFMNWSIWAPGAFDYAADKLGLTYGMTAELNQKKWALRGGYFLMGAVSNSNNFDTQVFRRGQYVAELETRYSLFSRPGKLRTIGWVSSANSGSYRETLNNPALNLDIAQTRTGRPKYGYVFNVEQSVTDDIGLFGRWSWNNGKTEIMSFTDIDASLSMGTSIKGTKWGRPDDVIGIGGAINALSNDHRDFIAAGGLGPLIGDGAAQLSQGTHPRNLLRLRAHQGDHGDGGLPVRHQSRLQCRPRPGPCLLREAARRVLVFRANVGERFRVKKVRFDRHIESELRFNSTGTRLQCLLEAPHALLCDQMRVVRHHHRGGVGNRQAQSGIRRACRVAAAAFAVELPLALA